MPQRFPLLPEMEKFVALRSPKTSGERSVATRRAEYNEYSTQLARPLPNDLDVTNFNIPFATAGIPVRLYQPKSLRDALAPCVVYFHGGGFVVGDLDSTEVIAAGIAERAHCNVINIDYPLSPEFPFPSAFDASYACIEWISRNVEKLGVDAEKIVLTGDSCGANIAAAITIASRDRGGPKIKGQILVNPWLSADMELESRKLFADGYGLTRAGLIYYLQAYLGSDASAQDNELAFPLNCTDLVGLPPTWVHVAECDPLKDDGRLFASKLIDAGVSVTYREAKQCVHAFLRARHMGEGTAAEFEAFAGFVRASLA